MMARLSEGIDLSLATVSRGILEWLDMVLSLVRKEKSLQRMRVYEVFLNQSFLFSEQG